MNEIERPQHDLRQLPPNYEFPLFSGHQAVESQRRISKSRSAPGSSRVLGGGDGWLSAEFRRARDRYAARLGVSPPQIVHQRVHVAVELLSVFLANPPDLRKNRVKWHRRPP